MKWNVPKILLALLVVISCVQIVNAEIIFEDDFEQYAIGANPIDWASAFGISSEVSADPASVDGQSFQLVGGSNWARGEYHVVSSLPERVALEGSVYMTSAASTRRADLGFLYPSSPYLYTENKVTFNGNEEIWWYGKESVKLGTWEPCKWYHVRVEIDFSQELADIFIDGQQVASKVEAYSEDSLPRPLGHWGLSTGNFASDGGYNTIYLDNVKIEKIEGGELIGNIVWQDNFESYTSLPTEKYEFISSGFSIIEENGNKALRHYSNSVGNYQMMPKNLQIESKNYEVVYRCKCNLWSGVHAFIMNQTSFSFDYVNERVGFYGDGFSLTYPPFVRLYSNGFNPAYPPRPDGHITLPDMNFYLKWGSIIRHTNDVGGTNDWRWVKLVSDEANITLYYGGMGGTPNWEHIITIPHGQGNENPPYYPVFDWQSFTGYIDDITITVYPSTPSDFPDLVITDISWDNQNVQQGDEVLISYTIQNTGNADAAAFDCKLYVDDVEVDVDSIDQLAAGASMDGSFASPWTATAGTHTVKGEADWQDVIAESDEGNNILTRTIEVAEDYAYDPNGKVEIAIQSGGSSGRIFKKGDLIFLSGTNTASDYVYLSIIGPNLPENGGSLTNPQISVVDSDPTTFTRVQVDSDGTWDYVWLTEGKEVLDDGGVYTIYAKPVPKIYVGTIGYVGNFAHDWDCLFFMNDEGDVVTPHEYPPQWYLNYEYPLWLWFYDEEISKYKLTLPVNLVWQNASLDLVKKVMQERDEEWKEVATVPYFDVPMAHRLKIYDGVWSDWDPNYNMVNGLLDFVSNPLGRDHLEMYLLPDGNIVGNAHHDDAVPHKGVLPEFTEKMIKDYFLPPLWESSIYLLQNAQSEPYSDGWASVLEYNPDNLPNPEYYSELAVECPVELYAYDSSGNLVASKDYQIPGSYYYPKTDSQPQRIFIFGDTEGYIFKILANEEDPEFVEMGDNSFNLSVIRSTGAGFIKIGFKNVKITENTVATIVGGELGANTVLIVDTEGDGSQEMMLPDTLIDSYQAIVNHAPTIDSISDYEVIAGNELTLTISYQDEDEDPLTTAFTTTLPNGNEIAGLPEGATFDGEVFSWTPTRCQGGISEFVFEVSDGGLKETETFTIEVIVPVAIDIDPDMLNLKSNGPYITTYIELPDCYDPATTDALSCCLDCDHGHFEVLADAPCGVDDYDADGIPDMMVKFSREQMVMDFSVVDFETEGKFAEVSMTLSGTTSDGIRFVGEDIIQVRI
ncbi:hypothetical protein AZH53_03105 [Methanomicrobiaceae archaeon CYW5]|uniref:CARDB domain-containing protein n=1 Tax=Methanovulcanius yangii TaxID=1789227 RepID=UPI0029CA7C5F|nr:CARDB domain-containing protein [Methanovulcanius yangii]MBT8507417.1 hypothetical protein [Methanovulcanius yangii]